MTPSTDLDWFANRFFGPGWSDLAATAEDLTGAYPVDIREEDGTLVVDAEMPGFNREYVNVNIENGVLSITAERTPEETAGSSHLSERRYTRVDRRFTLPTAVDESKVEAKLDNGVLHMEIPKTEESKAKQIEVK